MTSSEAGTKSLRAKELVELLSKGELGWHHKMIDKDEEIWVTNGKMDNHWHPERMEAQNCEYSSVGQHLFHFVEEGFKPKDRICEIIAASLDSERGRDEELAKRLKDYIDTRLHKLNDNPRNTGYASARKRELWMIQTELERLAALTAEGRAGENQPHE